MPLLDELDEYLSGDAAVLTIIKVQSRTLNGADRINYGLRVAEDAERFRERACECRAIAMRLPGGLWRMELIAIATELEREADKLEAEDGSDTMSDRG